MIRRFLVWLRSIFVVPPAVADRRTYLRRVQARSKKLLRHSYRSELYCAVCSCTSSYDPRCDGFMCFDHCASKCGCVDRLPAGTPEVDLSFLKETK